MRIYDVTVTLREGMPTYDGEPGPTLRAIKELGRDGEPATVSVLTLGVHCGTHVDAPSHVIAGGAAVDALPLDALIGPCQVVQVASRDRVTAADLERSVPAGTERLILKTSSSRLWAAAEFRRDFVALDANAAAWLVERRLRLVGIDSLSIDPYGAEPLAAHLALLGAGIVVLEGLDLRQVPPGSYLLHCLPSKLAGADGAPARVVLTA